MSQLRGGRWPVKYQAIKNAYIDDGINPKTGRRCKLHRCEHCNDCFPAGEMQADHIHPIVPITGFDSWEKVIERLYSSSGDLNEHGQYAYYGRVGGCLITGNEDGAKHCAMNILYSLRHLGYVIPPQADAAWLGEAGPGPAGPPMH